MNLIDAIVLLVLVIILVSIILVLINVILKTLSERDVRATCPALSPMFHFSVSGSRSLSSDLLWDSFKTLIELLVEF